MSFLQAVQDAAMITALQVLALVGPLLVLAGALHLVSRSLGGVGSRLFGNRPALWWLGFVGVPIHESGHLVMCLLFGHKVVEVRFFDPDPQTGQLGFVKHSYNPRNPWNQIGRFFIGVGPIFSGCAVLGIALWLLAGPELGHALSSRGPDLAHADVFSGSLLLLRNALGQSVALIQALASPDYLLSWKAGLLAYLLLAVGSHVGLSIPDLKGAAWGGFFLLVLVFLGNCVALALGTDSLDPFVRLSGLLSPLHVLLATVLMLEIGFWVLLRGLVAMLGR